MGRKNPTDACTLFDSITSCGNRASRPTMEVRSCYRMATSENIRPPEKVVSVKREVMVRHLANLAILHGVFYKGVYYHNGVGQPHSQTPSKALRTDRVTTIRHR